MTDAYLPLGEPPRDDVDAAARLLIQYEERGGLELEFYEQFFMLVEDSDAVWSRAKELRNEVV
jgi:hypothetical protein